MRVNLIMGMLMGVGLLLLVNCGNNVNSTIEESLEYASVFTDLQPIMDADNTTVTIARGSVENKDSYFQIQVEEGSSLINGKKGAWCLEWTKPMRSNHYAHQGVRWFSTAGNNEWKPLNYLFAIKQELQASDPELTFREFQAVVWTLAGQMGIAPHFDLTSLQDSELPSTLITDGRPNFSKQKVLAIVQRVNTDLQSNKSKIAVISTGMVGETDHDQQNIFVPGEETEILPETITAGGYGYHSCGLDTEGQVYCWGYNLYGQLGDGTTTDRHSPMQVSMPPGVKFTKLSAGEYHTLALDTEGNVWAWGENRFGQLGDGTRENRRSPVKVSIPSGIVLVNLSGGGEQSLALDTEGKAWSWGHNNYGQLGDGTFNTTYPYSKLSPEPVNMPSEVTFVNLSAGYFHVLALDTNGKAWAWGWNNYGQLGTGTTTSSSSPIQVNMPTGIYLTSVDGGVHFSLALDTEGKAWSWGHNYQGQLGNGTFSTTKPYNKLSPEPVNMPSGVVFTSLAGGGYHSLALDVEGKAWGWGSNGFGQLGDGTTTNRHSPSQVSMPLGVSFTKISTGFYHGLAIDTEYKAWSWGYNSNGRLGDGTEENRYSPVKVSMPAGVTFQ